MQLTGLNEVSNISEILHEFIKFIHELALILVLIRV